MEESEGKIITVEDIEGNSINGRVELFESRYDNEDDDIYPGEASICILSDTDNSYLIYESQVKNISININK